MATKYKLVKTPKSVITEEYLVELGFKKIRFPNTYYDGKGHCYMYSPAKGSDIDLITNESSDALVENWNVHFLGYKELIVTDKKVLKKLIDALKSMTFTKKRR